MKAISKLLVLAVALSLSTPALAKKKKKTEDKAATSSTVLMKTSLGDVKIQLDPDKAPISTKNFLTYVDEKFYDGTIFHRVISSFMIQGGGFDKNYAEKPTHAPIKNESQNGLKNARGTIAMARLPDPDSATAQFFINVVDNAALDYPSNGGYAVFGKVISGLEVVDKIKAVATGSKSGMSDVPVNQVVIESIQRVEPPNS